MFTQASAIVKMMLIDILHEETRSLNFIFILKKIPSICLTSYVSFHHSGPLSERRENNLLLNPLSRFLKLNSANNIVITNRAIKWCEQRNSEPFAE